VEDLEGPHDLEIGLALRDGLFYGGPKGSEGEEVDEIEVIDTEYPLPFFLLRLLGLLRELATVPAMDFEAYLENIPAEP
jgi:hypothetical protein